MRVRRGIFGERRRRGGSISPRLGKAEGLDTSGFALTPLFIFLDFLLALCYSVRLLGGSFFLYGLLEVIPWLGDDGFC